MSAPPVRVGLVGYGLAGSVFHAPLVSAVEGLQLAAVVTRDPQRREAAERDVPDVVVVDDVEDLLVPALGIEVVAVATANRAHVDLATRALEAGRVTVVDKPLAVDATGARVLLDRAQTSAGRLTVFQNRRWDDDFLTLCTLRDEGALGEVHLLESRFERWVPTPKQGWRERADPEEGGGVLLDLGSHLVDQAVQLLGDVSHVYAELEVRRAGAQVVDHAFIALKHHSGARSHLTMSSSTALPGPRLRAIGSRAGFVSWGLDPQEKMLRAGGRPGDPGFGERPDDEWGLLGTVGVERPVALQPGGWVRFYEQLAHAVRSGGPLPVDPADALVTATLLEAAERSSAERTVVTTPATGG